jgi:ribulose kinase
MLWRAMNGEQMREAVEDVIRVQLAGNDDGQAAAGKLIDHCQHAEGAPQ